MKKKPYKLIQLDTKCTIGVCEPEKSVFMFQCHYCKGCFLQHNIVECSKVLDQGHNCSEQYVI